MQRESYLKGETLYCFVECVRTGFQVYARVNLAVMVSPGILVEGAGAGKDPRMEVISITSRPDHMPFFGMAERESRSVSELAAVVRSLSSSPG